MPFARAITREPGPDFADGITTSGLGPPDHARMLEQHRAYVEALIACGLEVEVLDPLPGFPDAHFVEDTAVVLPEIAVITRPGADPRLGEAEAMASVVSSLRDIVRIEPPGRIDGGDVLQVGRRFFVGLSDRTDEHGARQLGAIVERLGYSWTAVPVGDGLHLKSSVNVVGDSTLLVTRTASEYGAFRGYRLIVVDDRDEYAANTLLVNDRLLVPRGFPRVVDALDGLGLPIIELDMSESRTMDGGLTCLSLRFT